MNLNQSKRKDFHLIGYSNSTKTRAAPHRFQMSLVTDFDVIQEIRGIINGNDKVHTSIIWTKMLNRVESRNVVDYVTTKHRKFISFLLAHPNVFTVQNINHGVYVSIVSVSSLQTKDPIVEKVEKSTFISLEAEIINVIKHMCPNPTLLSVLWMKIVQTELLKNHVVYINTNCGGISKFIKKHPHEFKYEMIEKHPWISCINYSTVSIDNRIDSHAIYKPLEYQSEQKQEKTPTLEFIEKLPQGDIDEEEELNPL
jgi:hypothetical protein